MLCSIIILKDGLGIAYWGQLNIGLDKDTESGRYEWPAGGRVGLNGQVGSNGQKNPVCSGLVRTTSGG